VVDGGGGVDQVRFLLGGCDGDDGGALRQAHLDGDFVDDLRVGHLDRGERLAIACRGADTRAAELAGEPGQGRGESSGSGGGERDARAEHDRHQHSERCGGRYPLRSHRRQPRVSAGRAGNAVGAMATSGERGTSGAPSRPWAVRTGNLTCDLCCSKRMMSEDTLPQ
jgi:hypothetical protein